MNVAATAQERLINGIFRKGRQCHQFPTILCMNTLQQHRSHGMPTPVRNLPCTRARRKATRTRKLNARIPHRLRNTMCPRTRLLQSKVEDTCC